jgi:cell division protease FtsH
MKAKVFFGRSVTQHKNVSAQTAVDIDNEIRAIIDRCYGKAKADPVDNRDKLDMMADALMQYETIDAAQIDAIMAGRRPEPPAGWGSGSGAAGGGGSPAEAAGCDGRKIR